MSELDNPVHQLITVSSEVFATREDAMIGASDRRLGLISQSKIDDALIARAAIASIVTNASNWGLFLATFCFNPPSKPFVALIRRRFASFAILCAPFIHQRRLAWSRLRQVAPEHCISLRNPL
jgi:hypothetical protein